MMPEAMIGFYAVTRCGFYMTKGAFCLLMASYGQYQCFFLKNNPNPKQLHGSLLFLCATFMWLHMWSRQFVDLEDSIFSLETKQLWCTKVQRH